MPMGTWTPRKLRSRYNNKSGSQDASKKQAFRRAAQRSKRFIKQGYNALMKPSLNQHYMRWGEWAKSIN